MGVIEDRFERNILTTTVDTVFNWARRSSLWWLQFGLACCARLLGLDLQQHIFNEIRTDRVDGSGGRRYGLGHLHRDRFGSPSAFQQLYVQLDGRKLRRAQEMTVEARGLSKLRELRGGAQCECCEIPAVRTPDLPGIGEFGVVLAVAAVDPRRFVEIQWIDVV